MDINKADLDRYITGNYGEDQFKESRYDMELTFAELREANVNRCEQVFHSLNRWNPNDWTIATSGEIGEALEVLGKLLQFANTAKKVKRLEDADSNQDTVENRTALLRQFGSEVADIVIYADLLLARCDLSLQNFVISKFNEVSDKRGSTVKL